MSKQLDLSKPLSQDQIDDLLERWPVEKVEYLVAQSNASEFDDDDESPSELELPEDDEDDASGASE